MLGQIDRLLELTCVVEQNDSRVFAVGQGNFYTNLRVRELVRHANFAGGAEVEIARVRAVGAEASDSVRTQSISVCDDE